jgi:hypothetical protein
VENPLREQLRSLLQNWRQAGLPPRWQLMNELQDLLEWRKSKQIAGLWARPPLMLTATIDDGWGHGLEVVELCARLAGFRIERIGLLQKPQVIVDCCRRLRPLLLGLTVLQFDSEPDLKHIAEDLPASTQIIAGGAPFQIDPDFAERAGVRHVARNAADFLHFLLFSEALQWQP